MQIAKWGNSLTLRIPADVVRELGLKEGDDIHIASLGPSQIAIFAEAERREALIGKLRQFRGWMPSNFKFDRDEANAR